MSSPENDRPVSARTREEDKSRAARFRICVKKWKDPVIAIVLLPTAIAVLVLGVEMRGYSQDRARDARAVRVIAEQQAANAKATAATAKATCQRTQRLGPLIADYYASDPKFPRDVLAYYRRTIPKSCPK